MGSHVRPSVKAMSIFFGIVLGIGVVSWGQDAKKPKGEKEGKEEKPILCLNQPTPCSELGRTRLMALYAKALVANAELEKAQANLTNAINNYNGEVKLVGQEEGQPEGTNYQVDLNAGTVKRSFPPIPTPPATPPPTTPAKTPSSTPAPAPPPKK